MFTFEDEELKFLNARYFSRSFDLKTEITVKSHVDRVSSLYETSETSEKIEITVLKVSKVDNILSWNKNNKNYKYFL